MARARNEWHGRSATAIQYHRHQRVAPRCGQRLQRRIHRHSVSQASTSGTGAFLWKFRCCFPPFSITGINEWHLQMFPRSSSSHTAIQYHRHQRVARKIPIQPGRDSGPPFSITGINEWHCRNLEYVELVTGPPFSITGINEWHLLALCRRISSLRPPFSITGINEWHHGCGIYSASSSIRHSVSQASTSGTTFSKKYHMSRVTAIQYHRHQRVALQCFLGIGLFLVRHSVSQASTSGTAKIPFHATQPHFRHSVSQASTSGT